ncbi:MAG TPA: colanic acid biosynthesis glycosyltransferase WcaL [Parvularcula sp.]|nr:colanic acid biosynthesis glycosyltransferase WcaL [Parvularcula sp.]
MTLAYLINQYPGISHTFIRREIEALERRGIAVARYAIRSSAHGLIATEDLREAEETRRIVGAAPAALAGAILNSALVRPGAVIAALADAIRQGAGSDAGVFRHLLYFAEAMALATWLRADAIGHIHAHFGTNSATVAMLAARINGGAFSMTVHGPEEFDRALTIALAEKIRRAAFVAAVSSYGRSQLRRLVEPEHWEKIVIVPCGVDKAFYSGALRPVCAANRFVAVARLSEQKGVPTLIEAAARLKRDGRSFSVTIIGDGELRGALEASIARAGLQSEIRLAGWKTPDEVRAAIEDAGVFVLPSYAEGLPVSIMEAMSLARPVISTYVAGIPELVVPNETGWLTPASDAEALAGAMAEAMDKGPAMLDAMGRRGRARVLARHDSDAAAAVLAAAFDRFAERGR